MTVTFYFEGRFQSSPNLKEISSPYNKSLIDSVAYSDESNIKKALNFAESKFDDIKNLSTQHIIQGLNELKTLVSEQRDDLAKLIALEATKPISFASIEVQRALSVIDDGIKHAGLMDDEFPVDLSTQSDDYQAYTKRFPIGIIVGITPFNFPLNLLLHKVIPSIASRNAIIIKPAVQTPLTALKFAELFDKTSLPKAMLQVLPCENEQAQTLIEDDRVQCLSFTGSTAVGKKLQALIPHKKVLLECGGMASMIVDQSANIDAAASAAVSGGYNYAGQTCISVQHVYVHHSVYYSFRNVFIEKAQSLKQGDPLDESVQLSGLISDDATLKVRRLIEDAVIKGASETTLISNDNEALIPPTLLEQVPEQADLMNEEAFGPVVCLHTYVNHQVLINKINMSKFGLQHALFSNDNNIIADCYNNLDVGGLMVNESPTWRVDSMPYGGVKESGNCKEGVLFAMRDFSYEKLMVHNGVTRLR